MQVPTHRLSPLGDGMLSGTLLFVLMGLAALLQYAESRSILLGEFRQGLLSTATAIARGLDGDEHRTLHDADPAIMQTSAYQRQHQFLRQIKLSEEDFTYVYTTIRTSESDYFFVVDGGDPKSDNFSPPMDRYLDWQDNVAIQEAMDTGMPAATTEPYSDEWGTFMSAYAPVKDDQGQLVAVLGIDVDLRSYFLRIQPMTIVLIRTLVGSFLIALVMGALVYFARRPREQDG